MEKTQTSKGGLNNNWMGLAIRAIGVLFIVDGVWSLVSAFMKWAVPSIYLMCMGFYFDIIGIAAIVIGYCIIRIEEKGRKFALVITWISLVSWLILSGIALSQGSFTFTYQLGSFQYSSESPLVFFLLIGATLSLRIGLIAFFSSQKTKNFFINKVDSQ